MPKSLTLNQAGNFSDREWDSIRHFTLDRIARTQGRVVVLTDRVPSDGVSDSGWLSFNGRPGEEGEPFVLMQMMENGVEGVREFKTHGQPYQEIVQDVLNSVETLCPQRIMQGLEPDGIAESNSEFLWALGKARAILEAERTTPEETLFNRLMKDDPSASVVDVGDACRQATWEVLRSVYGQNEATYRACWDEQDRDKARRRCEQIAAASLSEQPLVNFNSLTARLESIFPQKDMDVRAIAESAFREKAIPYHLSMVKEIRRVQDMIPEARYDCVLATDNGDQESPLTKVGQAFSAALAAWENGLTVVERSFAPELHLRLAREAVRGEGTAAMVASLAYEKTNALRQAAPEILGYHLRWREWAEVFAYNLSLLATVPANGKENALDAIHRAMRFREVEAFTPADAPDVLGAASQMNDCAFVLGKLGGDEQAALAYAHLDLLQAVQALGCQDTLSGHLCLTLIAQSNGGNVEAAQELQRQLISDTPAPASGYPVHPPEPVEEKPVRSGRGRR